MKIFNITKKTPISDDAIELKTVREKTDGMLAFQKPRTLCFRTRWGVHTFGMKYPIDVAVCDEGGVVRAVRNGMAPNRIFFWNPKYARVFEFPSESGVERGDILRMTDD